MMEVATHAEDEDFIAKSLARTGIDTFDDDFVGAAGYFGFYIQEVQSLLGDESARSEPLLISLIHDHRRFMDQLERADDIFTDQPSKAGLLSHYLIIQLQLFIDRLHAIVGLYELHLQRPMPKSVAELITLGNSEVDGRIEFDAKLRGAAEQVLALLGDHMNIHPNAAAIGKCDEELLFMEAMDEIVFQPEMSSEIACDICKSLEKFYGMDFLSKRSVFKPLLPLFAKKCLNKTECGDLHTAVMSFLLAWKDVVEKRRAGLVITTSQS